MTRMPTITAAPERPAPVGPSAAPVDRRAWAILAVLCLSVFVAVVDGTIVNVALPTIARDLGASTSELQWIVDAYTLVFAGLLLTAGSLGDRFGRKGFLLAGMVVFGTFSALAGLASSPTELIAARAVMGVGGAMIFPATLAILVNVFRDGSRRATAVSIWAATSGLAIALGPLTGGVLLEHFGWGSVFFVNVPVVAVAVVLIVAVVPTSRDDNASRFDPAGMLLSIAAIGTLVWTVIEAPTNGWTSTTTIGGFAVAAALLVAFVVTERRSDHPMLDVGLFRNARFSAGTVSINVAFFGMMGFTFLVTQYMQVVRGYSTLEAGARTVPFAVFIGVAAPASKHLVDRLGTKRVVATGLLMMSVGLALAAVMAEDAPYAVLVGTMFFIGGGLGIVNAPATDAIMGALDPEKAGVGSAVNDTSRQLGGTLGVAVLGSLFSSAYSATAATGLAALAVPAAAVTAARRSVDAGVVVAQRAAQEQGTAAGKAVQTVIDRAFMDGYRPACWTAAAVLLLGSLVAWRFLPATAEE